MYIEFKYKLNIFLIFPMCECHYEIYSISIHLIITLRYYRLSSGVRALALALVPSTITDYLALALAQAKSKLSEYL